MLSMQSQALISSFAWPLLDDQAMRQGWPKDWCRLHDAYLLNRFPQLGRDEVVQIRCLAWPPAVPVVPDPREAVRKLALLFTEVRGGRVILKEGQAQSNTCAHFVEPPQGGDPDWTPPEGVAKGWLYAARLVQPTLIVAYWCSRRRIDPMVCRDGVDGAFNQLEPVWGDGLGDYHIHQAAAIAQDHFFPLLPLQPDSWTGLLQDFHEEQWTPLDRGEFSAASEINFLLLALAHGGLGWLLVNGGSGLGYLLPGRVRVYWERLLQLLSIPSPKAINVSPEQQNILAELGLLQRMTGTLSNRPPSGESWGQGLSWISLLLPGPSERDHWLDGAALCRIWRDLDRIPPLLGGSDPRIYLFDRMLWLRNLIFRLFAQPPGIPGFANFKVWFGRSTYGSHILDFMRPPKLPVGPRNPLRENIEAVSGKGRVGRVEFRCNFADDEKIRRIFHQYGALKGRVVAQWQGKSLARPLDRVERVEVTFSQQTIKDEDRHQPDGICSLDGRPFSKGGVVPGPRHYAQLRKNLADVSNTVQFARRHPELLVRGLDIVNHERRTPNWVPALVYRFYNEQIEKAYRTASLDCWVPPPYRHTFHAGEDFWLPSDGLRAVYEPIQFQALRRDDRIGHGLVLGLDLDLWSQRSDSRVTRLGTHLDDLVWEWHLMRQGHLEDSTAVVEEEIHQTLSRMKKELPSGTRLRHFSQLSPQPLWEAYAMRFDYPRLKRFGLVGHLASDRWFDDQACSCLKRRWQATQEEHVALYCEYLCSRALWRAWEQSCYVAVDARRVARWRALQQYVINLVVASGIVIESCPTSNVLISGVNSYANHPVFHLYPPDGSGRLLVSLNTDDPITFSPNVGEEYEQLYRTALEEGISPVEALRWLEHIKTMGLNASFLPNKRDYPDRDVRIDQFCQRVQP